MSNKAGDLIKDLYELKKRKDAINEQLKEVSNQISAVEFKLTEVMEEQELDKIATDYGTASLKVEMYPQIEDMEAFIEWIYQNDKPDMIQKRVGTKAFKDYFDETNEYPDGITTYEKKTIGFRKKTGM